MTNYHLWPVIIPQFMQFLCAQYIFHPALIVRRQDNSISGEQAYISFSGNCSGSDKSLIDDLPLMKMQLLNLTERVSRLEKENLQLREQLTQNSIPANGTNTNCSLKFCNTSDIPNSMSFCESPIMFSKNFTSVMLAGQLLEK